MTMLETRECRFVGFEAKFDEWNLPYTFVPEIRLDDMRVADWAQVREGSHIAPQEQVAEYAEQMRHGAQFPPLVLMEAKPPVLIDGNTRRAAAKLLRLKSFPAYIVETGTVEMAKILAGSLNQMGGKRLTTDEAHSLALLMLARDMADEAVAREVGRSATQVRQWRRIKEAEAHAAKLGMAEQFETIDRPAKLRLAEITHDLPFAEAVKLVAEVKPKPKVIQDMVKEVVKAPSDTEAVDVVRQVRAELKPAGPPPHRPNLLNPAARQARMHLGGLIKLREDPVALVDLTHREEELARWTELSHLITAVFNVLGVEAAA